MDVNISGLIQTGGIFFAIGTITGILVKHLIKIALAMIGVYSISLYWLQQKGVITLHEEKFVELLTNTNVTFMGLTEKIIALLPTGGAFTAGFIL